MILSGCTASQNHRTAEARRGNKLRAGDVLEEKVWTKLKINNERRKRTQKVCSVVKRRVKAAKITKMVD